MKSRKPVCLARQFKTLSSSETTSLRIKTISKACTSPNNHLDSNSSRLWSWVIKNTKGKKLSSFSSMITSRPGFNKATCRGNLKKSGSGLQSATWWTWMCKMRMEKSLFCSSPLTSTNSFCTIGSSKYKPRN